MTHDQRRITLVARRPGISARHWDATRDSPNRIIFLAAFAVLRYALSGGTEMKQDVERVVIDRCATASQLLETLASLPAEFNGDVLFIRAGDTGFLSATGRGGDRVLYSLSARDVQFYLEAHGLIVGDGQEERLTA
ncbi:MAG TPA: hypothetical protein VGR02_09820 [Thermoanaerobaculia bacterium]|jgi:hypothetical protein|nr:hypothetical protein [Thermoanaerobaculia bacterium]